MPLENNPPSPVHRYEFDIICEIIEDKSRVLDLGCDEGDLLNLLKQKRNIEGSGVEVAEEKVYHCISKGLSVHHGDIDQGLADFPDKSFDYVILSETLQEVRKPMLVFKEILRVGHKCIVSFPNFGHWSSRWQLLLGRSPVTTKLPYQWYEGPNTQFLTIYDFIYFCNEMNYSLVHQFYLRNGKRISLLPNLMADTALFVIH